MMLLCYRLWVLPNFHFQISIFDQDTIIMNIYETIVDFKKQGREGVLVTVVDKEGHGPQIPGAKLLVCNDGEKIGTIGGGALEHIAIEEVSIILKNKKSSLKNYKLGDNNNIIQGIETGMICGGSITLFYEYIGTNENVIIFGAGHVGKALTYYLKPLDYNIELYDIREDLLDKIDDGNKHLIKDYKNIPFDKIAITNSYIVIMTHSHALDYIVLKSLYESDTKPKYIGMIASKKKSAQMIEQLCSELGKNLDCNHLYTPVGLKTGGSTPEEIALSIAAELQVIRYKQEKHKHARSK